MLRNPLAWPPEKTIIRPVLEDNASVKCGRIHQVVRRNTFEHSEEMTRLVALCNAHLDGPTSKIVIQFHCVNGRCGFLVLRTVVTL